jgi:hypothetical protein
MTASRCMKPAHFAVLATMSGCGRTFPLIVYVDCDEEVVSSHALGEVSPLGLSSDDTVLALTFSGELPVDTDVTVADTVPVTMSFAPTSAEVRAYSAENPPNDCPAGEERWVVAGALSLAVDDWFSVTRDVDARLTPDGALDDVFIRWEGSPRLTALLEESVNDTGCVDVTGSAVVNAYQIDVFATGFCDGGTWGNTLAYLERQPLPEE